MPAARTRRVGDVAEVMKSAFVLGFRFNRMVNHGADARRCGRLPRVIPDRNVRCGAPSRLVQWVAMSRCNLRRSFLRLSILAALAVACAMPVLRAQTPDAQTAPQTAPAWAQPGSATYTQVAPPADFHRSSQNFDTPIGIFQGQSDVGAAL